ncbi:selection and upkeep of intraepithelial T-cells protein 9-like [Esox lucius]|uniref:Ig-like domain-containing protein n=1 Tax=Esox lucius TaxID=8010 RepID=A0AAY5KJ08_ESOLU|nr:selection and upkeep of intraepithelial T-cells protein 9-like [Esox lucius]XP_034146565.1 selection and upkeep of intraepithelial T-cells protein 9-like [Esox lucius]
MEDGQMTLVVWMFLALLRPADAAAASSPEISVVGVDDMGVILKCEAGGLMYRPEMTWLNSDGNILPGGPTETGTDSDGRYTVRGHVTIQKTYNNMFICRVLQQQINHKMETEIHVPDGVFPRPKLDKDVIIGVLTLIGAVLGIAATVVIIKRKLAQYAICRVLFCC